MADKMTDKKSGKIRKIFHCKECDYTTSDKKDYSKHLLTAKHKKLTMTDEKIRKNPEKNETKYEHICECGKKYKHRQSLHKHQVKCKYVNEEEEKKEEKKEAVVEDGKYTEILKEAMKTIQAQQQQINDMMPLIGNNNTTNNTTNNNTTNNFNLNFFLNETCKDALNITDFIDSLRLQLNDLEYTADNGHVKGITNIFHTALSNMEENKRPMHCTDLKREVLYIKDNDEWNKDENKEIIKDAVDKVTNKNISNTGKWLEKYPEHLEAGSKDFEKYIKMTSNCMGTGEEIEQNKIVKNILKEVTIKKE